MLTNSNKKNIWKIGITPKKPLNKWVKKTQWFHDRLMMMIRFIHKKILYFIRIIQSKCFFFGDNIHHYYQGYFIEIWSVWNIFNGKTIWWWNGEKIRKTMKNNTKNYRQKILYQDLYMIFDIGNQDS